MGKRKSIILFISLIAISLFLCISTFSLLANSSSYKIENILSNFFLTYIIHSGFISGYQNRYGDNLKPPTNVYHRMTA